MPSAPAYMRQVADDAILPAQLQWPITETDLRAWETTWLPAVAAAKARLHRRLGSHRHWPTDLHWDWRAKLTPRQGLLAYASYALWCEQRLQALMILDSTHHFAQLPDQAAKPLMYVDYLATAPWNRTDLTDCPQLRGAGVTLLRTAIVESIDQGFGGRIGLHSLPQADDFYRKCGLTSLGPDLAHREKLTYFENTPAHATAFLH